MKQKYNDRVKTWMLINDSGRIVDYQEEKFEGIKEVKDIKSRGVKK